MNNCSPSALHGKRLATPAVNSHVVIMEVWYPTALEELLHCVHWYIYVVGAVSVFSVNCAYSVTFLCCNVGCVTAEQECLDAGRGLSPPHLSAWSTSCFFVLVFSLFVLARGLILKVIFHHSSMIHSVCPHLYANVRMGEDLQFTKQSWSFSRKQPCS